MRRLPSKYVYIRTRVIAKSCELARGTGLLMADGGELRAFFRAAQEDAAQAVENAAKAIGDHIDKTAQNVLDSLDTVERADRASADAFNGIRYRIGGDGGGDPEELVGGPLTWARKQIANRTVNRALEKVNPKYDPAEPAYSENCTSVVQANELRRRGFDVKAGLLEERLRSDQNGGGGRSLSVIEHAWGVKFKPGTKADIEEAFEEPGSRGVVAILWRRRGGHVFNVENVDGEVRFVDGQPDPPVTDASWYFDRGHSPMYARLDDQPTPPADATKPYLESSAGS
jgi:hypothetical protein